MNYQTAADGHLTAKVEVDRNIDEPILEANLRKNYSKNEVNSAPINSEPIDDNQVTTKAYIHTSFENKRIRRDLSSVFDDHDNEFDKNKSTNLDIITLSKNTLLDEKAGNEKYFDNSLNNGTVLRFNMSFEKY